ncbi:hypothetical protein D3C72_1405970 [compost metagenome]
MQRRIEVQRGDEEAGLAAGRLPYALARRHRQMKTARLRHPGVVVVKIVKHLFDVVADARIVGRIRAPVDQAVAHRRFGHAGHDGHFRAQLRRSGRIAAVRDMHHAHRIFHRHALRHAALHVDFRAPQGGQQQRFLADDQVAAIELGGHLHRQRALAQGGKSQRRVGRGGREIAAQRNEYLDVAALHGCDGGHHVVAMRARRRKTIHLAQAVEEGRRRLFLDAHRAVALHIGVAAHGT